MIYRYYNVNYHCLRYVIMLVLLSKHFIQSAIIAL